MTEQLSGPDPKFASRITLNLKKLVSDGQLSQAEAQRLNHLGESVLTRKIFANALLIFGAIMVVTGILALGPSLNTGLALAGTALALGTALIWRGTDEWWLLGRALVLMGVLGLCGWTALRFDELGPEMAQLTWPTILALTLAGAIFYRDAVLAALAPIALGHSIGGGTAYWHASYGLFMRESSVTILVFGLLCAALLWALYRVPQTYELVTKVMARVSFFLANFGFWIGSLHGDYPGQLWLADGLNWTDTQSWQATSFFIPAEVFSVAWAVFLLFGIYMGIRTGRSFIANTAIVFLAIHFYTQLYETFLDTPSGLVFGGVVLIGFGLGLVRFNRWMTDYRESLQSEDSA